MNPHLPPIENELRELKIAGLDEDFLTRLEACAEGTMVHLTLEEIRFEAALRNFSPARIPSAWAVSLEPLLSDAPFPQDGNILLFPRGVAQDRGARRFFRPMWSAAAAVALMGAATALFLPTDGRRQAPLAQVSVPSAEITPSPAVAISPAVAQNLLTPASFNRGLSEAKDEGILWQNSRPHRVVRVVYHERVTMKDENGRTIEVEQPRTEYILVPQKID